MMTVWRKTFNTLDSETISYISVKHETNFKLSSRSELSISRDFPRFSYIGFATKRHGKLQFVVQGKVHGSIWIQITLTSKGPSSFLQEQASVPVMTQAVNIFL